MITHIELHATLVRTQRDDRADVFLRHVQIDMHDRFANLLDLGHVRHLGRVIHHQHRAVALHHFIDHRRCGGNQVHVELALQPLLHDLHVQQAEETATETEAQGLRHFRLILQRSVIQLELFQRIAQRFILVGLDRE